MFKSGPSGYDMAQERSDVKLEFGKSGHEHALGARVSGLRSMSIW